MSYHPFSYSIIFMILIHTPGHTIDPKFSEIPQQIVLFHGLEGRGSNPYLVDLDDDGDLDVIFQSFSPFSLNLFWNQGSNKDPFFVPNTTVLSAFQNLGYFMNFTLFDYDHDHDLDLCIVFPHKVKIYINEGSSSFPIFSPTSILLYKNDITSDIVILFYNQIDLVGDSLLEVIISESQIHSHSLKLFTPLNDSLVEIPDYFRLTDSVYSGCYGQVLHVDFINHPFTNERLLLIGFVYGFLWISGGLFWDSFLYKNIGTDQQPLWKPISR